jgi:hypothetical protein
MKKNRRWTITMDFATAASQNGSTTYEFFLHKKTKIILKMAKNFNVFTFIFYEEYLSSLCLEEGKGVVSILWGEGASIKAPQPNLVQFFNEDICLGSFSYFSTY